MTPRVRVVAVQNTTSGRVVTNVTKLRVVSSKSNVALGGSFEDVVEAVLSQYGHVQRGHPATKVVGHRTGKPRTIYTAKNGVDFVGVAWSQPVAIEAKRLPGAASLSGAKDSSTRNEALWLTRFYAKNGRGAFLIFDPEADGGRGEVYLVDGLYRLARIGGGSRVLLRDRQGRAEVPSWKVRDARQHSIPMGLAGAVEFALRSLCRVPGES